MIGKQTMAALVAFAGFGGFTAIAEESWTPALRTVLSSEQRCDLAKVLWVREVPVGNTVGLEGRVSCHDGREFDFTRARPHMKFDVRLCLPVVC